MKRLVLTCAVLAIAISACGGSKPTGNPTPTPTASAGRLHSTGMLSIISPSEGATEPRTGFTLKLSLKDAVIVPQVSANVKPNEGHIHLLIDGIPVKLLGSLEISTGPLKQGAHLIGAEFVESNHVPFDPRVLAQVTVNVP